MAIVHLNLAVEVSNLIHPVDVALKYDHIEPTTHQAARLPCPVAGPIRISSRKHFIVE